MHRIDSPYYPPRARWYSPVFLLGQALRRRTGLDRLQLPDAIPVCAFIASLLVPGLAFIVRKERLVGRAILLGYGLLAVVFIVWLGYPVANIAFGLMLSAHVTSILFLLNPGLVNARFAFRILSSLALLGVVGACLYAPLRHQLQTRLFMPLRIKENVVVVQTFSSPSSIRRGDWLVYSLANRSVGDAHGEGGAVWARAGFGWGPVLGVAGDRIRFTPQTFEINGVAQRSLPHMPVAGELVVAEKHWFLWPEIVISGRGNTAEATIANAMLQVATVAETQFVGKPLKRWFGRRQILS